MTVTVPDRVRTPDMSPEAHGMSPEAHAVRAEHAPSGGDGGARVSPHGRVVRRGRGALGRRTAL